MENAWCSMDYLGVSRLDLPHAGTKKAARLSHRRLIKKEKSTIRKTYFRNAFSIQRVFW